MDGRIVVVGSVNLDLVVRAARFPAPGETIQGEGFATYHGGKGANQAVAAARLGGRVAFVGAVGDDTFGERLSRGLRDEGIDTTALRVEPGTPTGVALITVDAAGQNTIVVALGANASLRPGMLDLAASAWEGATALLLQMEIPAETVGAAVARGKQRGCRVLLNASPFRPLDREVLAGVDDLLVNEIELAQLAGTAVGDVEAAARRLLGRGVRRVVATLGPEGALLAEGGELRRLPAFSVPVVDTTAAGDAFCGAYAVAVVEGRAPAEAVAFGNAAGALAVTRAGAQPSLPRREELERFITEREVAPSPPPGPEPLAP